VRENPNLSYISFKLSSQSDTWTHTNLYKLSDWLRVAEVGISYHLTTFSATYRLCQPNFQNTAEN